jgi:hypothetical protein
MCDTSIDELVQKIGRRSLIVMVQAWVAYNEYDWRVGNRTKSTNNMTNKITRSPLQRRGFDEPMPPEGWAALRMFVPTPPLKRYYRFNKLK